MDCPDPDALLDFDEAIAAHVAECAACRWILDAQQDLEQTTWPVPGDTLGRYRVERTLGAGAMGVVFAAHDPKLRRSVAVKLWRPERDFAPDRNRSRLLAEARAMARVSHPNVVPIYDVGVEREAVFIAMERVTEGSLAGWLKTRRPWRAVLRLMTAAAEGLAAAHDAGLIHRDFKPGNVLLTQDGRVLVADFGLAIVDRLRDARETEELLQSATGPAGTPMYMAPEQLRGERGDARSDQYAFAVTLYEALYGHHPFRAATVEALLVQQSAGVGECPDPEIPFWVHEAVARGLAEDPRERFASMREFMSALQPPRRRRVPWSVGVSVAAALVVAAAWSHVPTEARSATQPTGHVADEERPETSACRDELERMNTLVAAGSTAQALRVGENIHRTCAASDRLLAQALSSRGVAHMDQAEYDAGERDLRAAFELASQNGQEYYAMHAAADLADVTVQTGRLDAANRWLRQAEAIQARFDAGAQMRIRLLRRRAHVAYREGKLDEHVAHVEHAIELTKTEPVGRELEARLRFELARGKSAQGHYDEARALWQETLPIAREIEGPSSPWVVGILGNLASLAHAQGRDEDAIERLHEVIPLTIENHGHNHPSVGVGYAILGAAQQGLGQLGEALTSFDRAVAVFESACDGPCPQLPQTLSSRSRLLSQLGDTPRAVADARRSVTITTELHGVDHPTQVDHLTSLAKALFVAGDLGGGKAAADEAVELAERVLPADQSARFNAFLRLGEAYLDAELREEARTILRRALALAEELPSLPPDLVDEARAMLKTT